MVSGGARQTVWRAAVLLTAVAVVAAGVWLWQRGGDAPEHEVIVLASQSAEAPLSPADPGVVPGAKPAQDAEGAPSAIPMVSESREPAVSLSQKDAVPGAGGPTAKDSPEPDEVTETTDTVCDQAYTYWDGDVERTVMLCPAESAIGHAGDDSGRSRAAGSGTGSADPLVFRTEQGVEMTLEHSIILILDPDWSRADVERFLGRNGIRPSTVSPLGWIPNGFTVTTGPGITPLLMANALAQQDGVVMSSPNWATEFEVK